MTNSNGKTINSEKEIINKSFLPECLITPEYGLSKINEIIKIGTINTDWLNIF